MNEKYEAILARREQAQHTPGPWLYEKSGINWRVYRIIQVSRTTTAPDEIAAVGTEEDAALIARAPELAADNERLRGLLAECVASWREEIEQWRTSGQPQYAMALERCVRDIEARQEATNAK